MINQSDRRKGTLRKVVVWYCSIAIICIAFSRPVFIHAATTEPVNEPPRITAISVLLFYAGVFGALIGAATGWVNAMLYAPKPALQPEKPEKP